MRCQRRSRLNHRHRFTAADNAAVKRHYVFVERTNVEHRLDGVGDDQPLLWRWITTEREDQLLLFFSENFVERGATIEPSTAQHSAVDMEGMLHRERVALRRGIIGFVAPFKPHCGCSWRPTLAPGLRCASDFNNLKVRSTRLISAAS